MNRAERRRRQFAEQKKQQQAASAKKVTKKSRTSSELLIGSLINMFCGVFGVGALPLVTHWLIAIDDPTARYSQDIYLLMLVLWGNTFYEVRCNPEGRLGKAWLRIYRQAIHWLSVAFMVGMAFAYAHIVAKANTSSTAALENGWLIVILLVVAVVGYLAFKVPVLQAEAADDAQKELSQWGDT